MHVALPVQGYIVVFPKAMSLSFTRLIKIADFIQLFTLFPLFYGMLSLQYCKGAQQCVEKAIAVLDDI